MLSGWFRDGWLRVGVVVVFALVGAACSSIRLGELDPPPGRQMIVDVEIHGNEALSDGEITDVLATYEDNLKLTGVKPLLDRTKLPADAQRVESFYAANGFFGARVTDYWVEALDESHVCVHFRVVEGRPTLVKAISFTPLVSGEGSPLSPTDDPDAVPLPVALLEEVQEELLGLSRLREGGVWTEARYREGKARIRGALRKRGFLFAQVLGDVFVMRERHEATVRISIAPGPLVRLKSIQIVGNKRVSSERILRRVDLEAGEILTPQRLRDTEADIYALRVFFGVSATPEQPSVDDMLGDAPPSFENIRAIQWEPEISVTISVQEMPMQEVTTGLGTALDSSRGEAYVRGGYQNRDLFGGLRYFDAELKPALVALPGFFDRDALFAPGGEAKLLFRQPSFIEEYLDLSLRATYDLGVEYGYKSHRVLGSPAFSRRFFHFLTLRLSYNILYTSYFDVSCALGAASDGSKNVDPSSALGLEPSDAYLLSYFEQSVELDWRDVIYDPRRGVYGALRLAESFEGIGSDFHYIRLSADLRGYWTPWRWLTVASQIRYGQVFNELGSTVPLAARFKAGGPSDMRGFGAGRMGYYICQQDAANTAGAAAGACAEGVSGVAGSDDGSCGGRKLFVGGNLLLEGSLELRFYLPANFGLVAFADVGELWPTKEMFDVRDLNVAVGPGLRYYTPFGPIRADLGVLVTDPRPGAITFHVSIGQAF